MKYNIKPKNLILSILRVSEQPAVSIKTLVLIGKLFGFTGNTIRVATARLVSSGKIESDERGLYRLSQAADPVNRYLNGWRDGEERLVSWDGSWVCCLAAELPAGRQARNNKAFGFLGIREGLPGLWIRPNNLRLGFRGIIKTLDQLGIESGAKFFEARKFKEKLEEKWRHCLWPLDELNKTGREILEKISRSRLKLKNMPPAQAVVESYLVGSEASYRLTMDPLLPNEILDASVRIDLTEAMLEYDVIGNRIWMENFEDLKLGGTPSHLQLANDN